MGYDVTDTINRACDEVTAWLKGLPAWPRHPTNASGSVSSHFGPTVLSEHDCVLHFARHLHEAGVPWEDQHLELSPGQWMFQVAASGWKPPKRIDLAVIPRERLMQAALPVPPGTLPLDAVVEFALASNYWQFGAGDAKTAREKVAADIEKVAEYLRSDLARTGYVIVFEECDHSFPDDFETAAEQEFGVRVRLLRGYA